MWGRRFVIAQAAVTVLAIGPAWNRSCAGSPRTDPSASTSRELASRGLENLVAFTRLLGYVRHFHPSDEAAATDWNAFTVAAVDTVERAESGAALATTLRALFLPIAPTLRIDTRPVSIDPAVWLPRGAKPVAVVTWLHHGFGGGTGDDASFWSHRLRRALGPGQPPLDSKAVFSASLGGGVWCALPLAVFSDSSGTLPHASAAMPVRLDPPGEGASGNERATRIADVVLFWNVAQHFYPYFDVVGADWPGALRSALQRAAADPDAGSFHDTLCRLLAALRDGHTWVSDRYEEPPLTLPIAWDWVEDQLVITQVTDSTANGPRRGDVVRSIDGETVDQRMSEIEPLIGAATPQGMRWGALLPLARGSRQDSVELELQSPAGAIRRVTLGRTVNLKRLGWDRPDKVAELRPGVLYVDLTRCTNTDLESSTDRMSTARGLVFDMRGYPHEVSKDFFGHLTDSPVTSPRWGIPLVARPDREDIVYEYSSWTVNPVEPRFTGRAAFLMDARDQSGAETYLQIVAHHRLAELVGEPTAGTDGSVVRVALPSGHQVSFTGMRVIKQDGSQLQGVGVLPTVPVSRTLAGVAAGRDELLERAIEVVSR